MSSDFKNHTEKSTIENILLNTMKVVSCGLVGSVALSIALNVASPGLVSSGLTEYMDDHHMNTSLVTHFKHQNVQVYSRHNPLVPFHAAGKIAHVNYHNRFKNRDAGAVEKIEGALEIGYKSFYIMFPDMVKRSFNAWSDPAMAYSVRPGTPDLSCYVFPPAHLDAETLASTFTGIDQSYFIKRLDVSPEAAQILAFAHEVSHCGQYENVETLSHETDGDLTAIDIEKKSLNDNNKEVEKFLLYSRAVGVFSKQELDYGHATALAGAMTLNGEQNIDMHKIDKANQQLREKVDSFIGQHHQKDRFVSVYQTMNYFLKNDLLEDPLMIRAAEMYVQGAQYFFSQDQLEKRSPDVPALKLQGIR